MELVSVCVWLWVCAVVEGLELIELELLLVLLGAVEVLVFD